MGRGVSWRVIRAAVTGTSHRREQLACQDACLATVHPRANDAQVLAIVVADGAGSARHGGEGAQLACEIVQQQIGRWNDGVPTGALMAGCFADARTALEHAALERGCEVRELACTLLVAIVAPEGAAYGHLGDGAIVADHGAGLQAVFWPESGEYANMTRFITDENALDHVRITESTGAPDELAVFTDGVQRLALDFRSAAVHAPFFAPMLAVLRCQSPESCADLDEQLTAFLDSPKVNSRTDDDKTLVLASRRST
jgi:hypothetical protein